MRRIEWPMARAGRRVALGRLPQYLAASANGVLPQAAAASSQMGMYAGSCTEIKMPADMEVGYVLLSVSSQFHELRHQAKA